MSDFLAAAKISDEFWDAACAALRGAWFLHTSAWRRYQVARGARDLSFALVEDGRIVAVVPLFLDKLGCLQDDGEGLPAPAMQSGAATRLEPQVSAWVDTIAQNHSVRLGKWRSCPLAENPALLGLFPGAAWRQWSSVVVDLVAPERWSGVRPSYRNLINRARREATVEIWRGMTTPNDVIAFDMYRRVYLGAFGALRATESFVLQRHWIAEGQAFLVTGKGPDGITAAAAYVLLYKRVAYYMSGPSTAQNLQHAVLWAAVDAAREAGARWFEVGWVDHAEDEKGKAVEFFKAGFSPLRFKVVEVTKTWP